MPKDNRFSDEFLNAFVDNQLDPGEKSRAYAGISQDEGLNRQVCELRKLHDLVQLAYRDVPAPPQRAVVPGERRNRHVGAVAAALALAVGVALGLQIQLRVAPEPATDGRAPAAEPVTVAAATPTPRPTTGHRPARPLAVASAPATAARLDTPPAPVAIAAQELPAVDEPRSINDVHIGNVRNRVLIHIAHDDAPRLGQALEEIEGLMRYYRDTRQSAHVEVVINGRGLELVRVDTSQHAAQIARLQKEYRNLTFAACQNTIDRLKREQGITARLLPGVVVTDSGMAEITRRQHQGWTYLQV